MQSHQAIAIEGRLVGPEHPPFIIAEVSANHAGSIDRALQIIEAAAAAGADAIKLQTYTPDTMTIDHGSDDFRIRGGLWDGYALYDLYKEAHTPWEWHPRLFARIRELGMIPFSTPFDASAVDFLESLNAPLYKIASFEVTDIDLVRKAASTGKPMIMSTGLANEPEIREAVQTARAAGCKDLILLHCVSAYPAPAGDANLRTMTDMPARFGVPVVGLSDHTLSPAVAVAAVALGASVLEKHFTLSRADGGPDSAFSLEPAELQQLVQSCRDCSDALGRISYERAPSESANAKFRRSVYVVADIAAGEPLTPSNVRVIRPAFGLPPKMFNQVLGRTALGPIKRGTPLDWSMISGEAPAASKATA
jgi:N-acetylneuraminate synthase